jgi:Tol biopolymer transport system component
LLRENLGRMSVFIAISTICAILLSSSFVLQINQAAWAGTFPGPNGQIAFSSNRDGNFEIYVMNADGSGQTRLTDNTEDDNSPSWSADGTKIAFASNRDGNFEIYVMNADGSDQTRLTDNSALDDAPSWSPDGTKIAFARHGDVPNLQNREIYVMNADGSDQTRLTDNSALDDAPSWSPDGTKIAFHSSRATGSPTIFVMNADGSNVTELRPNLEVSHDFDQWPSWSPDGTKIAFFGFTVSGGGEESVEHRDIYVMNADDGSDVTKLGVGSSPSWSPDGEKIASGRLMGRPLFTVDIFVMNADDGSGQIGLTNNAAEDSEPDWGTNTSPAGGGGNGDTTSPVITVPQDITEEATSTDGAQVTYTVTAQDDVDGNATLEEDGNTITQDDIGGDIDISCAPPSGSTFPIGETTVECSATDAAGNEGTASFTVTVNPPSPSTPIEVIEKLISDIQNLEGVPQDIKTRIVAFLERALALLSDDNPRNDASTCNIFGAFMNQVNANERQDTLIEDQARNLRTQAQDIRDMLGC